jgi:hypothetical protein
MLAIQRGLRRVGLGKLADWFESKTQSETLDLLRRAKTAITDHRREFQPVSSPASAIFSNEVQSTPADHSLAAGSRPDPFGLRAFGLTSISQLHPAYRDTCDWRTVPAVMERPNAVAAVRADLARIEVILGGMFMLDANGNIIIVLRSQRTDMHVVVASITALADRHDLGVLATKSAFTETVENALMLRSHGFAMFGAHVRGTATGHNGPPNFVTFTRKPAGAPLFSHTSGSGQINVPPSGWFAMREAITPDAYDTEPITNARSINYRKTGRPRHA